LYRILKYQINSNLLKAKKVRFKYIVLLALPLALSAFTHIWNSVEFPGIHTDEGHYVRRGIHVSEGLGAHEPSSRYDHPYFGWLFLGDIFSIIGYPNSLIPKVGDVSTIEAVWSVPRIIVGLLAVVDTFLIYKIAETRYNRKVAFIAAVLFAVMPYNWLTRRVLLESIQLPFILLSIFFAISYVTKISKNRNRVFDTNLNQRRSQNHILDTSNYGNNNSRNILLLSLSGIFLGLAIFTKIPAFTFIPVIGFLVYLADRTKQEDDNIFRRRNNNSNNIINTKKHSKKNGLKNLSLWFIPVILIPLIWPAYAISVGQYEAWIEGINFQVTRESKPLFNNIMEFYSTDPVLLILGLVGVGYCAVIKRELLFLIWIVPFLIFLYYIDYVSSFFLIPLIPPLCVAPAFMITDLSNRIARIRNRKRIKQLLPLGIGSVIAIFGLINTTSLILKSENSNYLEVAAAITKQLPTGIGTQDGSTLSQDDQMTVIGNPRFYWILQYVFDKPYYNYKTQYNLINIHTLERILEGSEKVIMIADRGILEIVKNEKQPDNAKAQLRAERLTEIYFNTELEDKIDRVEIRTNY
jgi:Dolichyl-phosphate-mannose-protein mannosyltransferase